MIRRPPRSTQSRSSAASDVYKRQVADSGRGIPADQLERVFDRFHRVEDPMLMTTGGTGLGLFLARELVHGMGGALVATSTLGVGSVLRFTLPTLRPLGPLPD